MKLFGQDGYKNTRVLPVAILLIVIAVSIAALISLARSVFFGSQLTTPAKVDVSQQALLNTAESHSVKMTVRGPIVASENFRSYQITVSPNSRDLVYYKGYADDIINSVKYSNSTAAYEQFVYALDKANLAKGAEFADNKNDTRGICATGRVFQFQILDNGNSVKSLWTSTCSGSRGSLNASAEQLINLFTSQIPDFDKTIKGL